MSVVEEVSKVIDENINANLLIYKC